MQLGIREDMEKFQMHQECLSQQQNEFFAEEVKQYKKRNRNNLFICTNNIQMEANILDRKNTIWNMEKENTFSKIEATTKDGGETIWCMERVNSFSPMEKYSTKENGLSMNQMDGVFYIHVLIPASHPYGHATKEKWKMDKCMAEGKSISLKILSFKVSSKTAKCSVEAAESAPKER